MVCKKDGAFPACIQEGSSLQGCGAAQKHALVHRDVLHDPPDQWDVEEDTSVEEPARPIPHHSEAKLLRIYLVDSYSILGYKRPQAPPLKGHVEVWYEVFCKLCYEDVYKSQDKPSCLHEIPELQEHASMHSDYLGMDGLPVPDVDLTFYDEWQIF